MHFTKIGNELSSSVDLMIGVRQDSVLGPLLFFIYINDVEEDKDLHYLLFFFDLCRNDDGRGDGRCGRRG